MQLLRGGGPRALAGVLTRTPRGLIRPLLPYSHAELIQWLRAQHVSWREDSSNLDPSHLRNRVRHELLPVLEGASPRLREHLVVLAHTLAEDEAHLCAELDRRCPSIDPWRADGGVPVTRVAGLSGPLRSRWLHAQAAQVGIGRVTRRQLATLNALLDDGLPGPSHCAAAGTCAAPQASCGWNHLAPWRTMTFASPPAIACRFRCRPGPSASAAPGRSPCTPSGHGVRPSERSPCARHAPATRSSTRTVR